MKTVKWLLVAILLMQAIQTAVLWYGLVVYPYEDDEEDDYGGAGLETRLSPPPVGDKIKMCSVRPVASCQQFL
jgi:hypothetical protein